MFGNNKPRQPTGQTTQLRFMDSSPSFSSFGKNSYNSDVVRSAVDAVARNAAKLTPIHQRENNDGTITVIDNDNLAYLLSTRPNPYMNKHDFLYKVITQLEIENNAYIYIQYDPNGNIVGFYPICYSNMEWLQTGDEVEAKFNFNSGDYIIVPYDQLIHLRRFFYKNDI